MDERNVFCSQVQGPAASTFLLFKIEKSKQHRKSMKARKNTNVPGSSSILFSSISVKTKGKFENVKGPGS